MNVLQFTNGAQSDADERHTMLRKFKIDLAWL